MNFQNGMENITTQIYVVLSEAGHNTVWTCLLFSEPGWYIAASKTFQNCEETQKKTFIICRLGYSHLKNNMDGWNVHWPPPKNNTLAAGWFGLALIHGQDWCIAASKTIGMIDLPQEQHLSAGLIGACPVWRSRLGKPLQLRALTFMDPCVPSFAELDRRWNIHKTRPFIQAQMFAGRKKTLCGSGMIIQ